MAVETTNVRAEVLNAAFIDKIDRGLTKEAADAGTAYIRTRLYEDGVTRRLFEPFNVTADDLSPEVGNDKPSIVREIEPEAPSATWVPFKGTGDRRYITGNRYRIPFGKIETTHDVKNKYELMTMKMDIMSWVKDKHVKKFQGEEDGLFMDTVKGIITDASGAQDEAVQISTGSLTFKDAFAAGLKGLTTFKLPVGKVLMHRNTFIDSLKLKVEDIGHTPQEKRFERGLDGETSFMGIPVVTTLESDLCAEGDMYFFAPQEYFCHFGLLQDATLFIKTEADMIEMWSYGAPGFGIGNTAGVYKIDLT